MHLEKLEKHCKPLIILMTVPQAVDRSTAGSGIGHQAGTHHSIVGRAAWVMC